MTRYACSDCPEWHDTETGCPLHNGDRERGAPLSPSDPLYDPTILSVKDSSLALKNADSMGLRERAEKVVAAWVAPLGRERSLEDAIVTFVQSERQQAAAEAYERAAKVAREFVHTRRDCEAGTTGEEIAEAILALPLTGGAK